MEARFTRGVILRLRALIWTAGVSAKGTWDWLVRGRPRCDRARLSHFMKNHCYCDAYTYEPQH